LVGTLVSAICAAGLIYVMSRAHGIWKDIRRGLPIGKGAAGILVAMPCSPADERGNAKHPRQLWAQVHGGDQTLKPCSRNQRAEPGCSGTSRGVASVSSPSAPMPW